MPIARAVEEALTQSSWIRRMFEEGHKLRSACGAEGVFDFTLGNPDLPPPPALLDRLRELTRSDPQGIHRYMPNAGWPEVRAKVAAHLQRRTGLDYTADSVMMTVGAGGALNACLKAILNPGDEVVILRPYFVEYRFYVANYQGVCVEIETHDDFGLSAEALDAAITERTRAVIINSPNNPTGRVYSRPELESFVDLLEQRARARGEPIYLITDEPYRKIVYDGVTCPEVPPLYRDTILVTSSSKDLGLAGERIGYLAVAPDASDARQLLAACTFCNRTLGFVNAPSLFQLAIADCLELSVDASHYRDRRDLLLGHLREIGLDVATPAGAFYLFPRTPIADDTQFVRELMAERILVVPGSGFGRPGHVRISYAVPRETIQRSLPAWTRALANHRKQ
ncbi:MAG: pyridoxal phosphate-dependent aminotransferase [Planctomycetota bacterium]